MSYLASGLVVVVEAHVCGNGVRGLQRVRGPVAVHLHDQTGTVYSTATRSSSSWLERQDAVDIRATKYAKSRRADVLGTRRRGRGGRMAVQPWVGRRTGSPHTGREARPAPGGRRIEIPCQGFTLCRKECTCRYVICGYLDNGESVEEDEVRGTQPHLKPPKAPQCKIRPPPFFLPQVTSTIAYNVACTFWRRLRELEFRL
jgi:hypothetical protein